MFKVIIHTCFSLLLPYNSYKAYRRWVRVFSFCFYLWSSHFFQIFIRNVLGNREWRRYVTTFIVPNCLYLSRTNARITWLLRCEIRMNTCQVFFFFFSSKIKRYQFNVGQNHVFLLITYLNLEHLMCIFFYNDSFLHHWTPSTNNSY